MYADDSTFNSSGKSVSEIEAKLNADLNQTSTWCNENGMITNIQKTNAMLITTWQKRRYLQKTDLELYLQGERISTVNTEKLLGVLIDNNLSWKLHIQKVGNLSLPILSFFDV